MRAHERGWGGGTQTSGKQRRTTNGGIALGKRIEYILPKGWGMGVDAADRGRGSAVPLLAACRQADVWGERPCAGGVCLRDVPSERLSLIASPGLEGSGQWLGDSLTDPFSRGGV